MNIRRSHLRLLFAAATTAFALSIPMRASASVIAATESDNGREFMLSRGDTLEVSLAASSGTGYTWQPALVADALMKPVGETKFKLDNPMPGAPGHQIFRFLVEASGTGTLEMRYLRPWEKGSPPAKIFKIMLIVR